MRSVQFLVVIGVFAFLVSAPSFADNQPDFLDLWFAEQGVSASSLFNYAPTSLRDFVYSEVARLSSARQVVSTSALKDTNIEVASALLEYISAEEVYIAAKSDAVLLKRIRTAVQELRIPITAAIAIAFHEYTTENSIQGLKWIDGLFRLYPLESVNGAYSLEWEGAPRPWDSALTSGDFEDFLEEARLVCSASAYASYFSKNKVQTVYHGFDWPSEMPPSDSPIYELMRCLRQGPMAINLLIGSDPAIRVIDFEKVGNDTNALISYSKLVDYFRPNIVIQFSYQFERGKPHSKVVMLAVLTQILETFSSEVNEDAS